MLIGTPPQPMSLIIDTGSYKIVVNTYTSAYCSRPTRPCISGNSYDPTSSTSMEHLDTKFSFEFMDGSAISGDYYRDVVYVAAQHLDNVRFGVADIVESPNEALWKYGVFGIGYASDELGVTDEDSVLDVFFHKKLITTRGYSLWQETKNSGHILFGGIDQAKYTGDLVTMSAIPYQGSKADTFISLNKLGISRDGVVLPPGARSIQAWVDSSSVFTRVPASFVRDFQSVDEIISLGDLFFLECDNIPSDMTIDFTFKTTTIRIPIKDMILRPQSPIIHDGRSLCHLMIVAQSDDSALSTLGHYFLLNVYTVFNLDQNEISFAQVKKGAMDSHIVEISAMKNKNLDSSSISDPEMSAETSSILGSEVSAKNLLNADDSNIAAASDLSNTDLASQFTDAENPGLSSADDSSSADHSSIFQNTNSDTSTGAGNLRFSDSLTPTNPEASIPSDAFSNTPLQTMAEKAVSNDNVVYNEAAPMSPKQGSDSEQLPTGDQPVSDSLTRRSHRGRRG